MKNTKIANLSKKGQAIPEWALIIAFISIVCLFVLSQVIAPTMNSTIDKVNNALDSVTIETST